MPDTHIVKQLARGTTAVLDDYTGPAGELLMDTTTKELVLQDGTTQGGIRVGSGATYTAAAPLSIDSNNEISVADATTSAKGVVQVGDNVTVSSGAISVKPWAVHAASHNDVDPTALQEGCIVDTDEPVGGSADVVLAEVEQTLTDDATKVPSSAAVYSAIQGGGGGGGGGGGDIWTDTRLTTYEWGRIAVGSKLEGLSLKEIIEMQVYGYEEPYFATFTVSTIPATRGIHEYVPASPTVSWSVGNSHHAEPGTISLRDHDNNLLLSEQALDADQISITYGQWTRATVGTTNWTLRGVSLINQPFTKTVSTVWGYRLYWGLSTSGTITPSIYYLNSWSTLTSPTPASADCPFTFPKVSTSTKYYYYYVSPVDFTTLQYSTNARTYNAIETTKLSNFTVTAADGTQITYYSGRSTSSYAANTSATRYLRQA